MYKAGLSRKEIIDDDRVLDATEHTVINIGAGYDLECHLIGSPGIPPCLWLWFGGV